MKIFNQIARPRPPLSALEQDVVERAQLNAYFDTTPIGVLGNMFNALLLCFFYWDAASRTLLLCWAGIIVVFAAFRMLRWRLHRRAPERIDPKRELRRITVLSFLMGGFWGACIGALMVSMPFTLGVVLAVLATGMMSGGAMTMRNVPLAALAHTGMIALGFAFGLVQLHSVVGYTLLGQLVSFVLILHRSITSFSSTFTQGVVREFQLAAANSALEESHDTVKLLLRDFEEQGADWLWEIDDEGRPVAPSPRFAEAAQRSAAALSAVTLPDLFEPGPERERLRHWLCDGAPFQDLTLPLVVAGEQRWWSLSARRGARARQGLRGVATDVTTTRRAETQVRTRTAELQHTVTELKEANRRAEAANQAKSAFLANMSHEIRTPLNGVLGMVQVLAAGEPSPVQRTQLDVIRECGESLLTVLNDVLDLSKIEAGKLELEVQPFDVAELARCVHSTFSGLADRGGAAFSLHIADDARGIFRGDSTRVRQILYNLVSNALKFTRNGEVRILIDRQDGQLQITVSDTGIGIQPDRLEVLFDKFTQGDASTTRQYGGTGLGLSICRQLAMLMHGNIHATSVPGQGSTFRVDLPLAFEPYPATTATPQPQARPLEMEGPAQSLRILAAEDNMINRQVLQALLEQPDVELSIVDDGVLAVQAWERQAWDVILMDVQMPNLDGVGATQLIRGRELTGGRRRTPVIGLTANVMSHQLDDYLASGMDQVVAKPIQIGSLFEAIDAVVGKASAASGETCRSRSPA
jgi:signal transduction histidine kinase